MVDIENIDELIALLRDNIGRQVVIHYICSHCGDEQVTDWLEVDEELIEPIKANNQLLAGYECTSCSRTERYLTSDNVFGVEFDETA